MKPERTGRETRKAARVVRSYAEFEARYFPALSKRKQVEQDRRQPAKFGTGIIAELMDAALKSVRLEK